MLEEDIMAFLSAQIKTGKKKQKQNKTTNKPCQYKSSIYQKTYFCLGRRKPDRGI